MPRLELVLTSDRPGLTAIGEIRRSPLDPNAPPVVPDVEVRDSRSFQFPLDAGDYAYFFRVDLGDGKFRLAVKAADGDVEIDGGEFDTKDGFEGRVFHFTVTP